jgi:hypothetical protein
MDIIAEIKWASFTAAKTPARNIQAYTRNDRNTNKTYILSTSIFLSSAVERNLI